MWDLPTLFLLVFYSISLAGGSYWAGTQYTRLREYLKGKTMPSNPKKARPLGNEAREKLEHVQFHILDADRQLETDSKSNLNSAGARISLWQAVAGIFDIFRMGRDHSDDNGSNGHAE
jgi:hypothetical protein